MGHASVLSFMHVQGYDAAREGRPCNLQFSCQAASGSCRQVFCAAGAVATPQAVRCKAQSTCQSRVQCATGSYIPSLLQVEDLVSKFQAMQYKYKAAKQMIDDGRPAPKSSEEWDALLRSVPAAPQEASMRPVPRGSGEAVLATAML